MIFSASKLGMWQRCPLQAHYRYDLHLPREQNAAATFGIVLHDALEFYVTGGDYAKSRSRFLWHWHHPEEMNLEEGRYPQRTSHGSYLKLGLSILEDFHQRNRFDQAEVLGLEIPFMVPFGEHFLTGYIDRLEIRKNHKGIDVVRIVDYKSKGSQPTVAELMLDVQFTVYSFAIGCREFWTGMVDPDNPVLLDGDEPKFPGLPDGEALWARCQDMPTRAIWYHLRKQKELDAGPRDNHDYMRLYRVCQQIQKAEIAGVFVPKIGEACGLCLAGDTEIVTSEGVATIGSLVGSTPTLLTTRGAAGTWVQAPVRSFGRQELYAIRFRRGRAVIEVLATAEHRWPVRRHGHSSLEMIQTRDLVPGLRAATCKGSPKSRVRASAFGIAHGIVYGDGHRERKGSAVTLHGSKDAQLLKWFPHSPTSVVRLGNDYSEDEAIRVRDLPGYFKEPPSLAESKSYLLGWLAGYFAADGHVTSVGQATISSASLVNIRLVRDVCFALGIGTHTITSHARRGKGKVDTPLYRIGLVTGDLSEDFFLIDHHRFRYKAVPARDWLVESIEPTGRIEEVFCATVPETHVFTLASGIVTGNCDYISDCEFEIPVELTIKEDDPLRWV